MEGQLGLVDAMQLADKTGSRIDKLSDSVLRHDAYPGEFIWRPDDPGSLLSGSGPNGPGFQPSGSGTATEPSDDVIQQPAAAS